MRMGGQLGSVGFFQGCPKSMTDFAYRKVGRCGPSAVSRGANDGRLVDVA